MKLKTLALAITASFALSGCFVDDIIDDIKGDIEGDVGNEFDDIKGDVEDDLENATEQLTNLTDILSNTSTLNRQVLVAPDSHRIYAFTDESTGINYSNTATDFTYSLANSALDLLGLDNNSIDIETTGVYKALPFVVTDLDDKIYAFEADENGCKSTVKFTGNTGERAEMCDGVTTTGTFTVSQSSALDNVLDLTLSDGESLNVALYKEGSLAFINNDVNGNFSDVSFNDFTIAPCHLPEEWHAEMDHCMVM